MKIAYFQQNTLVGYATSALQLAEILGETSLHDQYRFTVNADDVTLEDVEAVTGLCFARTGEFYYKQSEIDINFGIIRLFELVDYRICHDLATETLTVDLEDINDLEDFNKLSSDERNDFIAEYVEKQIPSPMDSAETVEHIHAQEKLFAKAVANPAMMFAKPSAVERAELKSAAHVWGNTNEGFSMVELLAVLVILIVLGVAAAPELKAAYAKATEVAQSYAPSNTALADAQANLFAVLPATTVENTQ